MKKKSFILVGNSNWGKTYTMNSLKRTKKRKFYIKINGIDFVIRTQSNDDVKKELLRRIQDIIRRENPYMIIVLCAIFDNNDPRNATEILEILKEHYEIYFFVLQKKWGKDDIIPDDSIKKLEKYGKVHVYKGNDESEVRAEEFKKYILKYL